MLTQLSLLSSFRGCHCTVLVTTTRRRIVHPLRFHCPLFIAPTRWPRGVPTFVNHGQSKRFILAQSKELPEWHQPWFLEGASLADKVTWLQSKLSERPGPLSLGIDTSAYLVVLRALAQSKEGGAPQQAEEWMGRLERHAASDPNVSLTVECYILVMEAWAKSQQEIAATRAEKWLNRLKKLSTTTHPSLVPNTAAFNAFLNACSKGSGVKRKSEALLQNAMKTEETLETLVSLYELYGPDHPCAPDSDSFNFAIRAWTRYRKDADLVVKRSMALLKRMEQYQRNDPEHSRISPNTQSYCMVMDAYSNAAAQKTRACASNPDLIHSSETNGLAEVKHIEDILQYLHDLYDAGHVGVVPNRVAYNTLLSAWARLSGPYHKQAPFESEKVLRKMQWHGDDGLVEAAPDHMSYSRVIIAWSNSQEPTAGTRAKWWLETLWGAYKETQEEHLRPQISTYNYVFRALRRDPVQTEKLLLDLMRRERDEGSVLKPNSESFAFVIFSWLKVGDDYPTKFSQFERCQRAWEWLEEVVRREEARTYGVSSSPDMFIGILKAASKCCDIGPAVLDLAIACFDSYRTSRHRVDAIAYKNMLLIALETLKAPEHDEKRALVLTQMFRDCRDEGLINNIFVKTLANSSVYYTGWTAGKCERLINELFSSWPLPQSWHRNVQPELIPKEEDAARTDFRIHMQDQPRSA